MRKVKTKPVIGMVAHHCCIRVYKEAKVLIGLGYEVHLVTNRLTFGVEDFVTVSYFNSVTQLHNAIKHRPEVDIWHVHNEPDWLVEQTLAAALPHQGVIFDVHDFESARWQSTPFQEQKIMRQVDACVHVSVPMNALALEIYGIYAPPSIVLPCHVPEAWYVNTKAEYHNNVVYEGGLDTPYKGAKEGPRGPEISFRDYGLLFDAVVQAGFSMSVYPSNTTPPGTDTQYAQYGVWVRPEVDYPSLMPTLSKYSWGIVGASAESLLMHRAMPNKLFEYMAAGVPVIVFNADTAGQFVKQLGVGIVIPTLNSDIDSIRKHIVASLKEQITLSAWQACKDKVMAVRRSWSMDAQIGPLCELYDDVHLGVKKRGTRRLRATQGKAPKS